MATSNLIEEIAVDSTCVSWAKYYKYTKRLKLEYTNGNAYEYTDIPYWKWRDFYNAESKGKFINRKVKPYYEFKSYLLMNEEDINKIADRAANIIIDYLESKQEEWNHEFITQVESYQNDIFGNIRHATPEEIMKAELKKLEKLLINYIENENYEGAAVVNKKIKTIKKRLK